MQDEGRVCSGGTNRCSACGGMCLEFAGLNDPEEIAAEKGGIRILLDEKWRKLYRANTPRSVFISGEMRGERVA